MALPSESNTDLTWLAFAYVSGELSDAETEAFERRLAHDQPVREAVAEAVALAGAIAALPPGSEDTLPMVRRRSLRPWLAAGAAAAACLAMAVGLRGPGSRRPVPVPVELAAHAAADPAGKVALAWSGLRQEFDREKDGSEDLVAWADEPDPVAVEPDGAPDHGLPSWLIEAAALGDCANGPKEN